MLTLMRKRALKAEQQDTASTADTSQVPAPVPAGKVRRTMQMISAHEAIAAIESQENGTVTLVPKTHKASVSEPPVRHVQPVRVVEKKPLQQTTPSETPAPQQQQQQQPELTAADKAIMRKQRDVNHQYGRRGEILFRWVLVGKIITQSCANTVLAQAAVDMAKRGKH